MAIADFRAQLDSLKNSMTLNYNTISQLISQLVNRINGHTQAKGNVHELTAKDINLGNIPNWFPATRSIAQRGRSNNAFMSPKRTDDYAKTNIYDPLEEVFSDAVDRL